MKPLSAPPMSASARLARTIYRRYFLAGIAVVLTAGATWGAWILWSIGFAESFTGVSVHAINAHGHAQIFGWMGLFIMGFGFQTIPRMWNSTLPAPRLAAIAFLMLVVGLVARTTGMAMAESSSSAVPLAMSGGALEIVAIGLFAGIITTAFRRGTAPMTPSTAFILAGAGWFVAQTVWSVWHSWNTMTATTTEQLVWFIATYQAPLRDLQIHGLALFMILGVSLHMLPKLFKMPEIEQRRAWWGFGLLITAVIGEAALFIAYRWTGNHALAGMLMVPWLMLAAGVICVALPWKLWRPMPTGERSEKFIRMAFGWLAFSLMMLLAMPLYQVLSGIPFSHAYFGAVRHAITVGFVSMMIMGMAARVAAMHAGVAPPERASLMGPFVLINLGCFLRVSLQTLTDWHPAFFAVVGISGLLEVTALAWWGGHIVRLIMRARMVDEPRSSVY